jgi:LacI family transcriptional regulator
VSAQRATLQDVAAAAAVSVTTVSRVINDGPNVRTHVRERVQNAVERLGYRPNPIARSLRRGTDATIGVVVDSLADIFFATFVAAIERVAVERGFAVVIGSSGRTASRGRQLTENLIQRQVAGLILVPYAYDVDFLDELRHDIPLIFADRSIDLPDSDEVLGDDHGGAVTATQHLLDHGHRRIAFLGDALDVSTSLARYGGYVQALTEAGIDVDPELVVTGCSEPREATEATARLLRATSPPSAFFSSNLRCTTGLVTSIHDMDRADVAVVGFGDFPLSSVLRPAVTVIDQDPAGLGLLCAKRVFARLDGATDPPSRTVMPVRLIARGSGELPCNQS